MKEALKLLKRKKSLFLRILEYFCGFLFAAALVFTVWAWLASRDDPAASQLQMPAAQSYSAPVIPEAPSLEAEQSAEPTPAPQAVTKGVSIPGYKTMNIKADTQTVDVDLYNPEDNAGYYYMSFEIRVPNSSGEYESVYASGLVEPGNHIYSITMTRSFPAGEYENCILHVQPYRIPDKAPTNNADVKFKLIAE